MSEGTRITFKADLDNPDRTCWACGDVLRVENIRWGRDVKPSDWFVHSRTGTPVCPKD